MRYLIGLLLATQLCACGNQQVYDVLKQSQSNDCDSLPWTQREQCQQQLPPDYQKYERERQQLERKN